MSWPEQVAIIGAGYMGRGIAEVLALTDTECVLADVSAERAADGAAGLFSDAARHEEDGLIPAGEPCSAPAPGPLCCLRGRRSCPCRIRRRGGI